MTLDTLDDLMYHLPYVQHFLVTFSPLILLITTFSRINGALSGMSAPLAFEADLANGLLRELGAGHQNSSLAADMPWSLISGGPAGGDLDGFLQIVGACRFALAIAGYYLVEVHFPILPPLSRYCALAITTGSYGP
jgi:hypothetical protein